MSGHGSSSEEYQGMDLVAGFFIGEFGHELMCWQGILRHMARGYDRVVVGCEEGHEYLYKDFADEFIYPDVEVEHRNMWMCNGTTYPMRGANFIPRREICLNKHHQDFIKYGNSGGNGYDLLIHARGTDNFNTEYRNWPENKWTDLVDRLDVGVACIGAMDSMQIEGADDLRGLQLDRLMDVMASSKLYASPSSGPAHLASLCGLKHVVWSGKQDRGLYSNEQRYKTLWNPDKTESVYIPSWQPTVDDVEGVICCNL